MGCNPDRQRGPLIGLAVGDALGAAVEFPMPGSFPEVTGYPLLLGLLRLPPLPDQIRGGVNGLAQARNSIAHAGGKDFEPSFGEIANGLAASLFALRHIRYVEEAICKLAD